MLKKLIFFFLLKVKDVFFFGVDGILEIRCNGIYFPFNLCVNYVTFGGTIVQLSKTCMMFFFYYYYYCLCLFVL